MSEFSDCYFLHNASPEDAEALLKRARRYGLILPASGKYVPFLVEGVHDAGGVAKAVVDQNQGVLLHYAYAADHGLRLVAYDGAVKKFLLDLQQRGPSELDPDAIVGGASRLGLLMGTRKRGFEALLAKALTDALLDVRDARTRIGRAFGLEFPEWVSCADLSRQSEREVRKRFPAARLVLKSLRGLADRAIASEPNEWCPTPGLPTEMYLPVPTGDVDGAMLERHCHHWLTTRDWDDERQVGFWMYTAYNRALPSRYAHLVTRLMNVELAFSDSADENVRDTIRGILSVCDRDFDWEPYLARKAGEQRL